jgi:hypothetical protein
MFVDFQKPGTHHNWSKPKPKGKAMQNERSFKKIRWRGREKELKKERSEDNAQIEVKYLLFPAVYAP